jgi:hypothetical protein
MCQEKTIEGVEAVEEILWDPAQPGSTRVAAWTALRDTGFDKPAQRIAFKDYTDHPTNSMLPMGSNELERMADRYARMIGADIGAELPMIDVEPERPASREPDDIDWDKIEAADKAEPQAEPQSARPLTRREQLRRPQQQQPREPTPRPQRIVRRRHD